MKSFSRNEPVAIIGVACRFPGGVSNITEYWQLLKKGVDAVTSLPSDRFCPGRFHSASRTLAGRSYTLAAGVVGNLHSFDPDLFGISRTEAQDMDPQQRLALETAWEAFEQARIVPSSLSGSETGVFVGVSSTDMSLRNTDDPCRMSPYSMTGCTGSITANRISHTFNLRGPSMAVDTACSSSLVALHLACEALRSGDIPLAVAGGVNILLAPYPFIGFSRARMLSPDGRCKVFDATGDGYVRSEGAGMVILKPLKTALRDGDPIWGIIAASGVNSDGRTTGIALPSKEAQAKLLRRVYADFKLDKNKLVYVEAHGTGTVAGDPVEAAAIGEVLGTALRPVRPLPVGSVKSNIGHLEPAAGIAGLIKALLILQHGEIPPNLHFVTPNPAIDFAELNITVPQKPVPLPEAGEGELIGVNSFGFGGTNAHVVLQRPGKRRAAKAPAGRGNPLPPLFLSAASAPSLQSLAREYAVRLEGASPALCYDLAAGAVMEREMLSCRAVLSAPTVPELCARLQQFGHGQVPKAGGPIRKAPAPGGVFVFSGNGSQWCGMGRALMEADKDFSVGLEEADNHLQPLNGWSLIDVLRNSARHEEAFEHTEKSQSLLFAVQVALVKALEAKGLYPSAVLGHSGGEVAAAWASGALSLKDAATLIHVRSTLVAPLRGTGGMAVANMDVKSAQKALRRHGGDIAVSAVNTGTSLTVAGDEKALRAFVEQCKKNRIAAKMLASAYPFHTAVMDGLKDDLFAALENIQPRKPRIPFFSTVTGRRLRGPADREYWFRNMRRPVLFARAVESAFGRGFRHFLEIGPSPVLRSYMRDIFRKESSRVYVAACLTSKTDEAGSFTEAWHNAWSNGWDLDRKKHFPLPRVGRDLPLYPWDREILWTDDTPESRLQLKAEPVHPLLGGALPGKVPVFENTLLPADFPWLADHVIGNGVVYPAAAFLESMLAAAAALYPEQRPCLERVAVFRPLPLSDNAPKVVRLSVDKEDGGLIVESRQHMSSEEWGTYAKARILPDDSPAPGCDIPIARPELFGEAADSDFLYACADRFSLQYGPAFRTVSRAWVRSGAQYPETLVQFGEADPASARGMHIPPTLLDGALQSLFLLLAAYDNAVNTAYLPSTFEKVVLYADGCPKFAHARLQRAGARSVVASFTLLDKDGRALLAMENCRFRRAARLEQQITSRPYRIDCVPFRHPVNNPPAWEVNLADVARQAEKILKDAEAAAPFRERAGEDPYPLLQLAALAAAHESALSLGKSPPHPSREIWLRALLERLEQAGLAKRDNDDLYPLPGTGRLGAEPLWRTLISRAPEYIFEAQLLAHVSHSHAHTSVEEYADREQTLVSQDTVNTYFSRSIALQPFVRAALSCVQSVVDAAKGGPPAQILHFAGDPTAMLPELLPVVDKANCSYTAAVKSEADAEMGRLASGASPAVQFMVLDPETAPSEHAQRYDLILLTWSLHTHADSLGALEACRAMLKPTGILCLLEHAPDIFTDYVFGTAPSWWTASPGPRSPVSALQDAEYWKECLERTGFSPYRIADTENDCRRAFLLLGRKDPAQAAPHALPHAPDGKEDCEQAPLPRRLIVAGPPGTPGALLAERLAVEFRRAGFPAALCSTRKSDGAEASDDPAWWRGVLTRESRKAGKGVLQVVFLAGYENRPGLPLKKAARFQEQGTAALAALAQAWNAVRCPMSLRVLTGGAMAEAFPGARAVPAQGALCGFARVLRNEMRGLDVMLIDLHADRADAVALLPDLIRELEHPTTDKDVVLSTQGRFVPRMAPLVPALKNGPCRPAGAHLTFDHPGRIQNLYWRGMHAPVPGPDEICVRVSHTGLNFRDVMWCMGLLPDEALENGFSGPDMGLECSGVVHAAGRDVKNMRPGDPVICFAPSAFSSYVLTPASAAVIKPEHMSFAEGATIPAAFMTAWYSIKHLARMREGEKILIHGAAGGVGLAAVQIATHLGLEIHATAGAPEKHAFLRRLGIRNLYSSRSLAFAGQVLKRTKGVGVDAVLNSLAGEAIPAGLSTLRPFGRFLELGKRDFFADTPLRLRPFSNNISYFGIDLDQLILHNPSLVRDIYREVFELFAQRKLVPLPHAVYSANSVLDAFQAMQKSAHIGKIVLSMRGAADAARTPPPKRSAGRLPEDATYLVTGGTDGLGLASAIRLADRGAKNLLLVSRSGPKDADSQKNIERLRARGVRVVTARADVANARALQACLKKHLGPLPPLRGVIHAAAILDDGFVSGLDKQRITPCLAVKGGGAYALHLLTLSCPLDFFVLYSSAAVPFGNPGQANYVAANCMLETLGAWRRAKGLPAQVIGWGAIDDVGMLTRNPKAREVLQKVFDLRSTRSDDALDWLDLCIERDIGASYYFGLDWQSGGHLPLLAAPLFSGLRPRMPAGRASEFSEPDLVRSLGLEKGVEHVTALLLDQISHVLRLPKNRLEPDTPLVSQGMDSLMSVELALAIEQQFGLTGYNLSLSEKTTAKSLAESLYAVLAGESDG